MKKKFNDIIEIKGKKISNSFQPYIIAEMACAHNGEVKQAIDLTQAAFEAGADAIQLQFFDKSQVVTPNHPAFSVLQDISFSDDEWKEIHDHAFQLDIDILVCTYDVPSVDLAIQLGCDGIKLNSADLSNPEVLQKTAQTGVPLTLGTGASTLQEISSGLETIYKNGGRNVVLMHGVQNFPTQREDLNISRIQLLQDVFEMPVGYHDHTDGEDSFGQVIDLIALGMGVAVLEKHITLDRSKKGVDYQAALEPSEFKNYVENMRNGYIAYGSRELRPFNESDLKYRKFQKKSIVAARDINAGEPIDRRSVLFIRNEVPGIAPIHYDQVEGKKTKKKIAKFENIEFDCLES